MYGKHSARSARLARSAGSIRPHFVRIYLLSGAHVLCWMLLEYAIRKTFRFIVYHSLHSFHSFRRLASLAFCLYTPLFGAYFLWWMLVECVVNEALFL